jgi:acyl-CoA synthetase (AMP-forming)/AMP-acid ligase II
MEVAVLDAEGRPLPVGGIGEICCRGPAVFTGYHDNPEATAKALRGGWFHTGDLGRLDARGLLYITGRESDMYISGGSNVYPREVEEKILQHPAIAAGAFTGSTRGGAALQAVANARPRPIPFYGELGSVNPVVALPGILAARGAELAATLAGSISLGCGQFCTSPGVIVLLKDAASDAFVASLLTALAAQKPHAMLTPAMRSAFDAGVAHMIKAGVKTLLHEEGTPEAPRPFLAEVSAQAFIAKTALHDEVFGPSSLIVRADNATQVLDVLRAVAGSLTVTIWGADTDNSEARLLVRQAKTGFSIDLKSNQHVK